MNHGKTTNLSVPKNSKKIASGFMGKFGKMMAGAGIGVGVAGMGVAAVMASGAYFIKTMEEIDGKKIKENVQELLSISDAFGRRIGVWTLESFLSI